MTHFVTIQMLLGEDIADEFRRAIRGSEREAIERFAVMSLPDAVRYVRDMLAIDVEA